MHNLLYSHKEYEIAHILLRFGLFQVCYAWLGSDRGIRSPPSAVEDTVAAQYIVLAPGGHDFFHEYLLPILRLYHERGP